MRPIDRLRRRPAALAVGAAIVLLAGVAWAAPSASGAYVAKITNSTDSAATAPYFHCPTALALDKGSALFQWYLTDTAGSTSAADSSGNGNAGTYQGTMATDATAPLACPRDGGTAWQLDGSTNYADFPTRQTNPQVFTIEIWFKTTVAGGKLIGFGGNATGASSSYDRQLFLNTSGAVVYGIYSSGYHIVISPSGGYNDGKWHYAAATLSSAGQMLYMDGKLVNSNATSTAAEAVNGYWRVGYDSISGSWSSPVPPLYFKGSLRYAAVYTTALTAAQIGVHWGAGSGT